MLNRRATIREPGISPSFQGFVTRQTEGRASLFEPIIDGRYEARLTSNARETVSALRLRHSVFNVEMGIKTPDVSRSGLEYDAFDFRCQHIVVIDRDTGETVGTYRLNTLESASTIHGFYSASEFTLNSLPSEVLSHGVEIGRACVAASHRNTKVLYLLLRALMAYLKASRKSYFFGCCSIFTQDLKAGARAFRQLVDDGYLHDRYRVTPRNVSTDASNLSNESRLELPSLFKLYLKLGARVCGPPTVDREFGSIDFFVLFDVRDLNPKYQRMFLPSDVF